MRKLYFLPMLLPVLMVVFLSCKKESVQGLAPAAPDETIAVKIAPNQSYILNLPESNNVSISRQAAHFSVSEALVNAENGIPSYRYIPATDFTGNDEVSLISSKTSINYSTSGSAACGSGSSDSKTSSTNLITLKITVAN
jgi:hypothetical protein